MPKLKPKKKIAKNINLSYGTLFKSKPRVRRLTQLEKLRINAQKNGFDVQAICQDGDCFFSSVEDQLIKRYQYPIQKYNRNELRKIVKEQFVKNKYAYESC